MHCLVFEERELVVVMSGKPRSSPVEGDRGALVFCEVDLDQCEVLCQKADMRL